MKIKLQNNYYITDLSYNNKDLLDYFWIGSKFDCIGFIHKPSALKKLRSAIDRILKDQKPNKKMARKK